MTNFGSMMAPPPVHGGHGAQARELVFISSLLEMLYELSLSQTATCHIRDFFSNTPQPRQEVNVFLSFELL